MKKLKVKIIDGGGSTMKKLKVKIIDGYAIRNTIDVDFSGYGSSRFYPYIPKNELWLDQVLEAERDYFVELYSAECKALSGGLNYAEARAKVCKQFLAAAEQMPGFTMPVHGLDTLFLDALLGEEDVLKQVLLGKYARNVHFRVVDGNMVRRYLDPKFIQGGNGCVYHYVNTDEVWIEKVFRREWQFIATHEAYERKLMLDGMSYDNAHDFACAAEKMHRRNAGVAHFLKD